jgi:hypothetical protein
MSIERDVVSSGSYWEALFTEMPREIRRVLWRLGHKTTTTKRDSLLRESGTRKLRDSSFIGGLPPPPGPLTRRAKDRGGSARARHRQDGQSRQKSRKRAGLNAMYRVV